MTIEEKLGSYLETLTGLPAFYGKKKQGVSCVVYKRISTGRNRTHSNTISNFERVRFQIDVYGDSIASVITITNQIKDNLDGNRVDFETAICQDDYGVEEIEDSGVYRSILDFFVWS